MTTDQPWERSIPEVFEGIVARYPDRVAVKMGAQTLTYDELNRATNRLAHALVAARGEGTEPIALIVPHSLQAIWTALGVLKAGKFFAMMDPSLPPARLAGMLKLLTPGGIVTAASLQAEAMALVKTAELEAGVTIVAYDALPDDLPEHNPKLPLSASALADVIYTSGSTGEPKGVLFDHRMILHRLFTYEVEYGLAPEDRILSAGSLSYGASWSKAFSALLTGATFYPFDLRASSFDGLAATLRDEGISVFFAAVSTLRQFLTSLRVGLIFSDLRLVQTGGDTVLTTDVELVRRHVRRDCLLRVGLSLGEANAVAHWLITAGTVLEGDTVPAGYVVPGKEVLILDENQQPLPAGQVGEIAVRSRFLTPGYWRRPDLTAERFLNVPGSDGSDVLPERICLTGDLGRFRPNGLLEHRGRKDAMVKIRGFRVEPGAVEAALLATGLVRDAVVVAQELDLGGLANGGLARLQDRRLVAYVAVWAHGGEHSQVSASELRRALAQTLPDYMIPARFELLDALPLNASGKVDRRALPPPNTSRPALDTSYAPPRTETERLLATIWAGVLEVDAVGIHDEFVDLGGNSIQAARIITRVTQALGVTLPLQSLFESPTIAAQAAVIDAQVGPAAESLEDILTALAGLSNEARTALLGTLSIE